MHVYLVEQGSYVHKKEEAIVVEKQGEVVIKVPMKDIETMTLFGAVQISIQCMLALLEKGIDISLMTQHGNFRGKVVSALGKNTEIRVRQVQKAEDDNHCLMLAQNLVKAKLENARQLLISYQKNQPELDLRDTVVTLKTQLRTLEGITNITSLRGHEGYLSKVYWQGFRTCLDDAHEFNNREYFPSPNPVNALLSFGYSFLSREIQSMLEAHSLDPHIGFYHQIKYGRASLALDLVEELRHIVIDRLVLRVLNKHVLTAEDFYESSEGGVFLKKDRVKIWIEQYEKFMNDTEYTFCNMQVNTRSIIRIQCERLKRWISQDVMYDPTFLKTLS